MRPLHAKVLAADARRVLSARLFVRKHLNTFDASFFLLAGTLHEMLNRDVHWKQPVPDLEPISDSDDG